MYVVFTHTASALAFDQYGQLSEQLEQESAMRERAETMATQVHTHTVTHTHAHTHTSLDGHRGQALTNFTLCNQKPYETFFFAKT